jgi:hypothetical protein
MGFSKDENVMSRVPSRICAGEGNTGIGSRNLEPKSGITAGAGVTNICGGGEGKIGLVCDSSEFKLGKTNPYLLHINVVKAFTI